MNFAPVQVNAELLANKRSGAYHVLTFVAPGIAERTTLLMLGLIAVSMLMAIIWLANKMNLRYAENPAEQLLLNGVPVGDSYTQETVIAQISRALFSNFSVGFYFITAVTGVILILAANTAFNGFPVLASILAHDKWLPAQLRNRGDRLAYSNGIIILALAAGEVGEDGLARWIRDNWPKN